MVAAMLVSQAVAGDVRREYAKALFTADLELYDFYSEYKYGLRYCAATFPELTGDVERASAILSELLDGAAASIRARYAADFDFVQHDAVRLQAIQEDVCAAPSPKDVCTGQIVELEQYKEQGMPLGLERIVLLHTDRYAQHPEYVFDDEHVLPVRYAWAVNGRKRACTVRIPATWEKEATLGASRTQTYRSALGYGVPFFSLQAISGSKHMDAAAVQDDLRWRTSVAALQQEYGIVETLAGGMQQVGTVPGAWVIFRSEGTPAQPSGYYYNWYLRVGDSVLQYCSGVNEDSISGELTQESMFKKYYQTLREIALSTVVHE